MYMVRLYFTVMHLLTCCNFVYRLSELVSPPTAVTEMDWINRHWPDNLHDDYPHTKPQVSQIHTCIIMLRPNSYVFIESGHPGVSRCLIVCLCFDCREFTAFLFFLIMASVLCTCLSMCI